MLAPWKKRYDQPNFSSNHVLWEMDHKEGWAPNNWCFWIVVLEETPESPLDCKETQPVHPKGDQSFVGCSLEGLKLKLQTWATWFKELIHWKRLLCWQDWREEEKGMTEDEMVGQHHQLGGEFEQTPGIGDEIQLILSSVVPFSSCLLSFPASGSFPMSQLFTSCGQHIGALASVLPMNIQGWVTLGSIDLISLQSKGLSRGFSNTPLQKHQFFGAQPSLWYNSHIHKWLLEKHGFNYSDLCWQSNVSGF